MNLSATDSGSGIEQLRYWINNGPVSVAAGNTASTQVSGEGTKSVGFRALDNAGNISAQVDQAVNIDFTAPAVSSSAFPSVLPPNGKMVPVAIYGAITDKLSGVDVNSATFAVVDEYGKSNRSGA